MAEMFHDVVPNGYRFSSRESGSFCSMRVIDNQKDIGPMYTRTWLFFYERKPDDVVPEDWIPDSVITPLLPDIERLYVFSISKEHDVTHLVRGLWDKTIEFFYCENSDSLDSVRDSIQTVRSSSIIRAGQIDWSFWAIYPYDSNDRFE